MGYREEFPDYPEAEMPALPKGFEDTSWRNDCAPTFAHAGLRLMLWVDFPKPEDREFPECERFGLKRTDDEGALLDDQGPEGCLFASETLADVLAVILGEAFAAECREVYEPHEMETIRQRNATPKYEQACATHDFADANEVMLSAFTKTMGREPLYLDGTDEKGDWTPEQEADLDLWNRAWTWAKTRHLTEPDAEKDHETKVVLTDEPDAEEITLASFFDDNSDGIGEAERATIRAALRQWGVHHGGGGAAAMWKVELVDRDASLSAEFNRWLKEQGLPDGDAEELLMFGTLTGEQRTWIEAFVTRWKAVEVAE